MAGDRNIKYMRRDCINAVSDLLQAVNANLPYAGIHTEGIYYSDRNVFRDSTEKEKRSKGDKGARLGIVFGGNGRDVTSYMFHMRDLSSKESAHAKSLRYTPEGRKPAVLGAWSLEEATRGEVEQLDTSKLIMDTSRMMNSVSFEAMFHGYGDDILTGTLEERCVEQVLEAANEGGMDAMLMTASDGEPMAAMTAWGYVGRVLEQEGGVDPDDPRMAQLARQAMGFDALYDCLSEINDKIAADQDYKPDLSEYLNPDTIRGRRALQGLACLSAYKEARDHGGIYVRDESGRTVIGVDMDNPDTARVHERLVNTRAHAELYQKMLSDAEQSRSGIAPARCVQMTFAGIERQTDRPPKDRVDNATLYRFYRSVMLDEDPDMPSGAPDMKLSLAKPGHEIDLKRLSANDIILESNALPKELNRMPFAAAVSKAMSDPDGAYGAFFRQFPVMDLCMSRPGGMEQLSKIAVSRMQSSKGESIDGLSVETDIFLTDKDKLAGLTRNGRNAAGMAAQFISNFGESHSKSPQLLRSLDASTGLPDFSRGTGSLGRCVLIDAGQELMYQEFALGQGGSNPARTARAFRRDDAERAAVCSYGKSLTGKAPASMKEVEAAVSESGSTGVYHRFIDRCHAAKETDPVQASAMQNDFVVLSDCYHIKDEAGLQALAQDIAGMYSGQPGKESLYRPRDRAENAALLAIYADQGDDWKAAGLVPLTFQNHTDGFLQAAWHGADGDSEKIADGAAKISAYALDLDTLYDSHYGDLAAALSGPPRSRKMMEMARSNPDRSVNAGRDAVKQIDGLG